MLHSLLVSFTSTVLNSAASRLGESTVVALTVPDRLSVKTVKSCWRLDDVVVGPLGSGSRMYPQLVSHTTSGWSLLS